MDWGKGREKESRKQFDFHHFHICAPGKRGKGRAKMGQKLYLQKSLRKRIFFHAYFWARTLVEFFNFSFCFVRLVGWRLTIRPSRLCTIWSLPRTPACPSRVIWAPRSTCTSRPCRRRTGETTCVRSTRIRWLFRLEKNYFEHFAIFFLRTFSTIDSCRFAFF